MFRWWGKKRLALGWLLGIALLALLGGLVANSRPLICKIEGGWYAPGLAQLWRGSNKAYQHPMLDSIRIHEAWKSFDYDYSLFAPIPYSASEWSDDPGTYRLPPGSVHGNDALRFRHLLGTDAQGRDIAAGLVSGARIAALTGLAAAGISLLLGILFGSLAGFWGDQKLLIARSRILAFILFLLLLVLYLSAWRYTFKAAGWHHFIWTLILALVASLAGLTSRLLPFFRIRTSLPVDMIIMRSTEIIDAVPRLVLIVALAAMAPVQSLWLLIFLIGLFSWTDVARILRAELLRIRNLEYIAATEASGLSPTQSLIRHALPNALPVVVVVGVFSVASAILLEASLSFLGYGNESTGGISWGRMLSEARNHPEDWWVSVFPGGMIAITLFSLYTLSTTLQRKNH